MIVIRTLLLLTAFATALVTGYKVGENLEPVEMIFSQQAGDVFGSQVDEIFSSKMDTVIMPGVAIPDNNQFNLLLIGVDDWDRPDANLESIWLTAHLENSSKITFIPVFPSPNDQAQNLMLSESFYMDGDKPSKEFWDAMRKTKIWWKGYLISDIAETIRAIDHLGGVPINSQQINGFEAIRNMTSWKTDALMAINQQKIILEGICNQISTTQAFNLKSISEILNNNFRFDNQAKILITKWITSTSSNEKLTCAFPTLTQQPSLQSLTVSH